MSDLTVQQVNEPKKNYAKKGAIIAMGSYAAMGAASLGLAVKAVGKDTFERSVEAIGCSKKGYAAAFALCVGVCGLLGAGIGKIVEACKTKKEN